jgi:hypothetical protein
MTYHVIFGGASITDDTAWPTWKSYCVDRYQLKNYSDLSKKGIGNKTIISRCFYEAKKHKNPLIILMLTSFDKWDWYLPDIDSVKIYQNEKHSVTKLCDKDPIGVWGTGSHFPLDKEYYKKKFFNQEFNALENLIYISWFIGICKKNNWNLLLYLDSPIFDYYEFEINNLSYLGTEYDKKIIKNSFLLEKIYDEIKDNIIYSPGLIGFSNIHNLEWKHKKFNGHPGSLVHYLFSQEHIFPYCDNFLDKKFDIDINSVKKDQSLWVKTNKI